MHFLLVAALGAFVSISQAQFTIFSDNLDANTPGTSTAGYTFGDVANTTFTYVAGAGTGGSIGAVLMTDLTVPGVGYGGAAYQYQRGNMGGLNTSANLGNYTLTFDAKVNVANGGFQVGLQTWPNSYFSGTASSTSITPSDYILSTPNVFQHITLNLGTLTGGDPGATAQTWQLSFQLNGWDNWGVPSTGDTLTIDNVQVTMVPEPTALALVGFGVAGMLLVRRRRKD